MVLYIQELLQNIVTSGNVFIIIALSFLAGFITSFTPCLYPMIPITMGILQSQATQSMRSNFFLTLSYVLGMATVYSTLGYIAATSALMFGRWASNPYLIGFIAIIFLYLAFSMFGFYELHMPSWLTQQKEVSTKRPFVRSFLLGIIAGTVASPCLTPPLAILLAFVAKTGNQLIGLASLFSFALGMGLILLIIGTFSNSLSLLPRAGTWMMEIKKFFGFVMLIMTIYIATPLLGETRAWYGYSTIIIITILYYLYTITTHFIKRNQ